MGLFKILYFVCLWNDLTWKAGTVLSLTLPRWLAAVLCCQLRPAWPGCVGEREVFDETGNIRDRPRLLGSMGLARGFGGGYKLRLVVWVLELWVCRCKVWICDIAPVTGACCAVILLTEVKWSCDWLESLLMAEETPAWQLWPDIQSARSGCRVLPDPPPTWLSYPWPPVSWSNVWN